MFLTTVFIFVAMLYFIWRRYRDPFHPLIYLLPQMAFLYGYLPMQLANTDGFYFDQYLNSDTLEFYQFIAILLVGSLAFGVRVGGRSYRPVGNAVVRDRLRIPRQGGLLAALIFGLIGVAAWVDTLQIAGGFVDAYSKAYGGGWSSNGYIIEATRIGIVGSLFVFLSSRGKLRVLDLAILLLCLTPTLVDAFLGARRGPAFIGLVLLFGSYIYFTGKRVSVAVLIGGGFAVGLIMLLLVSQRSNIYLGSTGISLSDPTSALRTGDSNEYLIGAAVVQYAQKYGVFYGAREVVWLIARVIPGTFWPTIYDDLPRVFGVSVDLRVTGGIDRSGIATVTGWTPALGSAEGFVGSLWLEFGWLSVFAAMAIGFAYGRIWKAAKHDASLQPTYMLMIAFSVYLVMQALDPWLYRLLLFGLPTYFLARALARSSEHSRKHRLEYSTGR
jgi:hypothetical protein